MNLTNIFSNQKSFIALQLFSITCIPISSFASSHEGEGFVFVEKISNNSELNPNKSEEDSVELSISPLSTVTCDDIGGATPKTPTFDGFIRENSKQVAKFVETFATLPVHLGAGSLVPENGEEEVSCENIVTDSPESLSLHMSTTPIEKSESLGKIVERVLKDSEFGAIKGCIIPKYEIKKSERTKSRNPNYHKRKKDRNTQSENLDGCCSDCIIL